MKIGNLCSILLCLLLAACAPAEPGLSRTSTRISTSGGAALIHTAGTVQSLYVGVLGRPADVEGLAYWMRYSGDDIENIFRNTIEAKNYNPQENISALDLNGRTEIASAFTQALEAQGLSSAYRGARVIQSVRATFAALPSGLSVPDAVARLLDVVRAPALPPRQVWFAPMDPAVRTWANNRSGPADYMDLFQADAPWTNAASHVAVFKLYSSVFLLPELPGSLRDDQLRQLLADLKRRNITLAVEYGPLSEEAEGGACGVGVEGFGGAAALRMAQKISALGGDLRYLAMDEPYQHARDACHWSAAEIARNAAASVRAVRSIFPQVQVGDIEVVPGSVAMPDWAGEYAAWLDAWQAEMGEPLAFFHADLNWATRYETPLLRLGAALQARGVPFGIIYNGYYTDTASEEWIASGIAHFEQLELAGAAPQQVVFQSWDDRPRRVLPETDPGAMTHLVASYFRPRTYLLAGGDGTTLEGRLERDDGQPLAGAPVTIEATPLSGPGVVSTYTVSGTVPAGVAQGQMQICVNQCGETGPHEMVTYAIAYADAGGARTTLRYGAGVGWGIDSGGTAQVRAVWDSYGPGLRTSATASQHTYVNSPLLSVTPGARFTVTITARIPPATAGSGTFNLIFLAPKEVARKALPFAPAPIRLASVTTGSDGAFTVPLAWNQASGEFQLDARYAGTAALWPALARSRVVR